MILCLREGLPLLLGHWWERGPGPPRSQDSAWGDPVTFGLRPGPGLGGQRVRVHAPNRQCVLRYGPGRPPPAAVNLGALLQATPRLQVATMVLDLDRKQIISLRVFCFQSPPASPEIVPRDNVLPSVSWLSPSSPKAWGAVARQGGTCAGLVARDPVWMSLRPPDSPAPAPRAAARLPPCVWDIPAGIPWCSVAASDATLGCQASSPLPSSPCPP